MKSYDIVIIGAGAAGMTAAIYTARKKLSTVIISADIGGQTNLTSKISNYPGTGIPKMHGVKLMKRFQEDVDRFGADTYMGLVQKVEKKGEQEFHVHIADGEVFQARAVILSHGKVPKTLGLPGEDKFTGHGVSTSVMYDIDQCKGIDVAIVGGGNSAVEGAIDLAAVANRIYLIHRRQKFTCDEITLDELKEFSNVEIVTDSVITEVSGDDKMTGVVIENVKSKEKRTLDVGWLFMQIGFIVDSSMVKDLVDLNEKNEIIVDMRGNTSCPGIFAAGDITQLPFKQTVICAGDGAKTALECHLWLNGGKGVSIDWT